ncbi:MAG TPA: hydroxymethylbilane synthase [Gemmatimonadaceae bacterium]|nr:hydroxymethylbilane synthase [Gemmatimonadaceae bacterium]
MMTPPSRAAGRSDGHTVRIGTRSSELALRQARLVQSALGAHGVAAELVTFKTTGDKQLDQPLSAIGAKGLFTKELETALLAERVDCCVHSLKDLPTQSPDGVVVVALLEREDPRDVLVVNHAIVAEGIDDLPRGSRVGTSSLRRRAQLRALRRDIDVVELRGNVPTRLRKVDSGQVHAAILAAAGLMRLDVRQRITAWLEPPAWLPAAGQGAIAVQTRSDDERMKGLLAPLHHAATGISTSAERAFLAGLQGGCQVPIGALALQTERGLVLHGFISDVEATRVLRGEMAVDPSCPDEAGARLADELMAAGAEQVLATLRSDHDVPAPQPE